MALMVVPCSSAYCLHRFCDRLVGILIFVIGLLVFRHWFACDFNPMCFQKIPRHFEKRDAGEIMEELVLLGEPVVALFGHEIGEFSFASSLNSFSRRRDAR